MAYLCIWAIYWRVNARAFINTLGRCIKTRNAKFREVLIEKKTFNLVFGGFYNPLTNYRYQGANWDGNVFDTHAKLLQLLSFFVGILCLSTAGWFFVSTKCISEKRVTDIARLPKLLNGKRCLQSTMEWRVALRSIWIKEEIYIIIIKQL